MNALQYKWSWVVISILLRSCLCYSVHNYAPKHEEYKKSSDYSFSYGVKDLHTGDIKHQWEKKSGDSVKGHYSLVEPDGSIRSVDYIADKHHGFNAVVKHSSPSLHPADSKEPTSHSEILLKPQTVEENYEYKLLNTIVHPSHQTSKHESEEDQLQYQYQAAYAESEEQQKYDASQYEIQNQEDEGGDTAETFLFLPPEETASGEDKQESESQRSTIQTDYNGLVHYATKTQQYKQGVGIKNVPQRHQYQVINQHTPKEEEVDEGTVQDAPLQADVHVQPFSVEYRYPAQEQANAPAVSLEVNLSKPASSNAGVDESYLNPISIDLSKITSHKDSKYKIVTNQPPVGKSTHFQHRPAELTQQELDNYLKGYSQAERANTISLPSLETGFKPITGAPRPVTAAPSSVSYPEANLGPGTFRSNKKPKTTPGLRNYATRTVNAGGRYHQQQQQHQQHQQVYQGHRPRLHKGLSPVPQAAKQIDFDHLVRNNQFVTYKHVEYEH